MSSFKSSITTDAQGLSPFNRPIAIFSDFDGTIFLQDTGHILFDHHGCGPERREMLDEMISTGEKSFRGASEEMWGSLNVTLEDGFATMKDHLVIDEGFQDFFSYALKHNVPFNVISAGLKPLLRHVLDDFMGLEKSARIGIVSNDAVIAKDGSHWTPKWRHDCELGHDKALSIKEYKDALNQHCKASPSSTGTPLIVFIGDGVSDLAAAGEADILFARKGLKLEQYCIKNGISYIPYDSFADIQNELEVLVVGNVNHDSAAKQSARPRPMRTSSHQTVPVTSSPSLSMKAMLSGVAFT